MRSQGLSRRIVSPRDCAIAFAPVVTERGFHRDLARDDKQLARSARGGWDEYRQQVARPARRFLPRMRCLGASIAKDATLADFGALFQGRYTVVILMAHWEDPDQVEFADGFADVDSILGVVPGDASCVVDLGVCHPEDLAGALLHERPHCLIRQTRDRVTPFIWLSFYFMVLHQLRYNELTYLEAIERVILERKDPSDA